MMKFAGPAKQTKEKAIDREKQKVQQCLAMGYLAFDITLLSCLLSFLFRSASVDLSGSLLLSLAGQMLGL